MSLRIDRAVQRDKKARIIRVSTVLLTLMLLIFVAYEAEKKLSAYIVHSRMNLVAVKQGALPDHLQGQALVINREYPIKAQQSGRFENMVAENQKVSIGQPVGLLINQQGKKTLLASPYTGIFSIRIDGLEEVLREPVLNAIGPESFHYKPRSVNADGRVLTGQILFKIVDNLHPNALIVRIDTDANIPPIKAGDHIRAWSEGQELGSATVREIRQDTPGLIWLELNNFCERLLNQRYLEVDLEIGAEPGCLIPAGAIISRDQGKIVYCYREGKIFAESVDIIKEKEGQSLVKGLEVADIVVGNPKILDPDDIIY